MSDQFTDLQTIQSSLISDGWLSPNTYSSHFSSPESKPSIYLFMLVDTDDFKRALVAYVGMSENLSQRLCVHEIKRELNQTKFWVPVWFKPIPSDDLRSVELNYIQKFNPPWNILGKRRGLQDHE
jgi:hypothetical protein